MFATQVPRNQNKQLSISEEIKTSCAKGRQGVTSCRDIMANAADPFSMYKCSAEILPPSPRKIQEWTQWNRDSSPERRISQCWEFTDKSCVAVGAPSQISIGSIQWSAQKSSKLPCHRTRLGRSRSEFAALLVEHGWEDTGRAFLWSQEGFIFYLELPSTMLLGNICSITKEEWNILQTCTTSRC